MLTRLGQIHHEITGERLELIEFARKQRQESTDAEALLWSCLRDRRVNRRKFRRQHPVRPYTLDFYCAELRLAIELDGGQHNSAEGRAHDEARRIFLESKGIQILRFTNKAMLRETDSVLSVIWDRTRRPNVAKLRPLTQPLPEANQ
jgi:very-short-patch-repair endonuclease